MVGLEVWPEVQIPTGLDCVIKLGNCFQHCSGLDFITASVPPFCLQSLDGLGILASYIRETGFVRAGQGPQKKQWVKAAIWSREKQNKKYASVLHGSR